MKEIINELKMSGLTLKQKAIVWYFTISFCTLCVTAESSLWAITLIVLNFANAARLIKKVPLPDTENEETNDAN